MNDPIRELQEIKGVGAITAQRMVAAGLDSFAAIVNAGEAGLHQIQGLNPRNIPSILEQAAARCASVAPDTSDPVQELKQLVEKVRTAIQNVAETARGRFPEDLSGKIGRKLTRDMVTGLDALYALEELLGKRPRRSRKALVKTLSRIEGLAEGDLAAVRKGMKKARKTLERVIS